MSSSQAGGRKISGEEKNLANAQASLFSLQTQQLQQLQQTLMGLQPQTFNILGLNPQTGMALRPGELPPAPAAVANPGPRPVEYRTIFSGKNWGKNDQRAQDQSIAAIRDWEARNQQYQQYVQQKQAYDQQIASIQARPQDFYLPNPQEKLGQFQDYFNQVMSGQLPSSQAFGMGTLGAQAATTAGFGRQLQDIFGGGQPQDAAMAQLLANYQNQVAGNIPEAGAMQQLLDQYGQQLAGNIPEAGQLQGFLNQISTGQAGQFAINPAVQRALDEAEQQRRTRMFQQLGPGWETSTAGFEAMSDVARNRAGTIDALNQQDMALALSGYSNLLGGAQARQANTIGQYLNTLAGTQNRQAQTANQYLGFSGDKLQRTASALSGFLNTNQAAQNDIWQNYQNEWARRTGQASAFTNIQTAPFNVDFTPLINSYTGALQAATQRQTGPVQGGIGGPLGSLAGTALGGGLGFLAGGPAGALAGAGLGSSIFGNVGSAVGGGQSVGYQPPPLFNYQQSGGGGLSGNPFGLESGSFFTSPYFYGSGY